MKMKKTIDRSVRSLLFLATAIASGVPSDALAGPTLLTVSPRDAILRVVDGTTGETLSASITLSLEGEPQVNGVNGLARHPTTGDLYALVKVPGSQYRLLVTVDETTGTTTRVGPTGSTGDLFAGMAFASDGTLFAVTGDGALTFPPASLCTLSLVDGSATSVATLGNGSDGEALAFHPPSGLLYHASGLGTPNDPNFGEILETISPVDLTVTPVTLSGYDYTEVTALGARGPKLFAADLGGELSEDPHLLRISEAGHVTLVGPLDHVVKGIVVEPSDGQDLPVLAGPWIALALAATGAAAARRRARAVR